MMNDKLTKTFSFEKPPKEKKERNYKDFGFNSTIRRKSIKPRKKPHTALKFRIPKEKTRSQLIKILDKLFSDYIKKKANNKCARCGQIRKNAGVSHFWSRKYIGTRWSIENCDWLCWLPCHYTWEHQKNADYNTHMLDKLGATGYKKLQIKALGVNKFSTQEIKLMINNFSEIWK